MGNVTQRIYEEIKNDLPKIEQGLKTKNGSGRLWKNLKSKYSILIPEIDGKVKESGKISSGGEEFDYRSELEQFKEVILAYLIINPIDEQSNEEVSNKANQLLNEASPSGVDDTIIKKIEESKIYIRSSKSGEKQIALEKIWDCLERLKTILGENKKDSIKRMINRVSHGSDEIKERLNSEFNELTSIGNTFQIRHFETDTEEILSDSFREYLYFRVLSLVSYCINEIKNY
ncbi:hypothetical protein [Salimicrobium humidisoli]|uniref:Abortive infection C-terminus n=1 Tax=Salimicrobium humidisoli TaxID=2029857 RepID=A0ABX4HSY7_9BACI|nr:hypothetical protein [Salimicrobium humidisoli]PBB06323.1 hypothetical protein CKW00_04645 [Salimicrobium humidisoli]